MPMCICAMLAAELPLIPQAVADEVRAYFHELTGWLAAVLEAGVAKGQFHVRNGVQVEAQAFMSTIHGAMLTARAFGDAEVFASITRGAIKQLTVPA
ncbi:hypothetical protein G6F56_014426 [Rhizopus delemar]|nr:hypothetical protein G6F65_016809 [Rhizopus arrhizus]KAG1434114.1 hypothetical protein G6F56_014426 [Rhizopus delemar]